MSEVIISVGGVDITDDIIFSDAEFTSAANGRAGTCKFRVRDSAHIYTLVTGKQITLTIDGTFEWGGYISQVQRGYFFDAYDCRCRVHVVPRFLEVHGVDWNVLFQRRYLYDLSNPTDVQLTQYPADTFDSTVINYYVANHLDLTGDGITTGLVEHVGTPSTDAPISGAAGWTWGQFMAFINFNVGAIWYIDPDRVLVYCDVDTPNAPYGISDDPGAGEIGCQNLEISFDGSELANDALVWGMGQGSQDPVFSRVTDYDSLNEHNRWQVGAPLQAIWKQTTADRTANSYVYGSPQNKRGGKDDAVAVRCTVYTPGFRVAQKVAFRSVVFGFEDVIPIRVLRITFPTQTQPKWELTISHAIDAPWTGFDFFPFDFGFKPPVLPPIVEPIPLPPSNPCADFVPSSFTTAYPANLADYNTSNTTHPGTCFDLVWHKRTGTNPIAEYGNAALQQFTSSNANLRFGSAWQDVNANLGAANYTDDAELISVRSYQNPYHPSYPYYTPSGNTLTSVRLTAELIQPWDVDNGTLTPATWELYSCDVGDPALSHGLSWNNPTTITNSEFQTVWGTARYITSGTQAGGSTSTFIDVSWPVDNPQYIQFFLRITSTSAPSTLQSGQSYARYATNDDSQQWESALVSSNPVSLPFISPNHVLYLNSYDDPCASVNQLSCANLSPVIGSGGLTWDAEFVEYSYGPRHGPFFSRIFSTRTYLSSGFHQTALGGVTVTQYGRTYLGYNTSAGALNTFRITGSLGITPAWSGSFSNEARAFLPDTPWELIAVYYDSDDLDSYTPYDAGNIADFDLDAYEQQVIASGTKSGDPNVFDDIDITFLRDTTKTETAFFLKNLATETVVVYDLGGGGFSVEAAPVLDPSPPHNTFEGGHALVISNFVIGECIPICDPVKEGSFYWQPNSWKWNPVTVAWEAGETNDALLRRDNTLNYSYYTAWIAPGAGPFDGVLVAPGSNFNWTITVDNQGGLVSIAGKSYSWELVHSNWGVGPPTGTDPGGDVLASGVISVPAGPTTYEYTVEFPDRDISLPYTDQVELYLRWTSASGAASDTVSITQNNPADSFIANGFVSWTTPSSDQFCSCCGDNPPPTDPPQGQSCSNLTRIAAPDGFPTDDSYWEMAGTYQLGTTQVWVDGLFLQQNVDYTEHPDQSFIQIDSSIAVESGGAFFGAEPGQKIVYACANYQSIYGLIA
jgi:hypothetical protein